MFSQTHRRERVMLRFHNISEYDLKRVDGIVWGHLESSNWIFSNSDTWAGVLVANAKAGSSINRDAFSRGALFDSLKKWGFGNFSRVPAPQVEAALRQFVQNPSVMSVTCSEEAEAFLKSIRDSVVVDKLEKASVASKKDTLEHLEH